MNAERRGLSKRYLAIAGCLILAAWSLPAICGEEADGDADHAARADALRVLNDSAWAHTVTPTTQATACDWEHPAFPGLVPEDAALRDAQDPRGSVSEAVKPDTAEYLIRWLSVKPVQAALQQMVLLDEGWAAVTQQWSKNDPNGSGNRDRIRIDVILKHPGADGSSFLDYALSDHGQRFPSGPWHVWPCAGLKTPNGEVFAHAAGTGESGPGNVELFFPRFIHGRPLITSTAENVQFRFIARQRVFETTFTINARDVLDGSEDVAYFSSALQ